MTKTKEQCKDECEAITMGWGDPMGRQIRELLRNSTWEPVPNEEGVFGIAAQVVLTSGYGTAGILTVEKTGILRMIQPGLAKNPVAQSAPGIPIFASHYFSHLNVETIVIVSNAQPREKSRIVMEQ